MTSSPVSFGARARASTLDVASADVLRTAATRCLILCLGVGASVLTSRLLLPNGRGEYFWVVTVAQMVVQFSNLGLQSSNTYLVARDRAHLGALLGNSLIVAVAVGGLAALAVASGLRLFPVNAPMSVWVVVALVPAMLLQLFTGNLLIGMGEVGWFNRVQLASNVTVLGAMLVAGATGMRAPGFLVAITAAWTATGLWASWVVARQAGLASLSVRVDRAMLARGWRYSAKAYVVTLCGFLVLRSSVFVLQSLSGYQQVGYFSVAAQLCDVLAILPQSVSLVLFPSLVSAPATAWRRASGQAVAVALILGVVCVLLGITAPAFVPLAFGAAFQPSVPVVRWLLPAAFFLGVTSVLSQFAAASGFPRRLVAVWGFGLGVGVLCSATLVPRFAAVGAAMSLSVTQGVILMLILHLCLRIQRARAADVAFGQ